MSDSSHDALGETLRAEIEQRGITDPDEVERIVREVVGEKLPDLVRMLLEELEATRDDVLAEYDEARSSFEDRLRRRWSRPLKHLQQLQLIAEELGAEFFREVVSGETDLAPRLEALVGLHVRGCRVAREIQCLLRGGFPSGALSRWRTLHEIVVVAVFLAEHDEDVAERYLLHSIYMTRKDIRQYERYCDDLGFEPIERTVVERLSGQKEELENRFGKAFLSTYGWAAEAFAHPSPSMVDLAESVGLQHLRPFTNMANHLVHAGSKGLTWSIGTPDDAANLHSGATNYGLADPGQLTAHSLTILTTTLLAQRPTVDRLVYCYALDELSEETAHEFVSVQRDIEEESVDSEADATGENPG